MKQNINSDNISEHFRKYIIKLVFADKTLFALWGTDLNNEDFDYLLTDDNGNILAFVGIKELIRYVQENDLKHDQVTTKLWAKGYTANQAYISYDLINITKMINSQSFDLMQIKKAGILELINFYNLFSDYVYQIKDEDMTSIIKEKNTKLFFDFAYSSFFNYSEEMQEYVKSEMGNFSSKLFTTNYKKILETFERKINIFSVTPSDQDCTIELT